MTQDAYQPRIQAWLDGEMTAGERADFEEELSRNPELAANLRQTAFARDLLRELPRVTAPPEVLTRVRAVRAELTMKPIRTFTFPWRVVLTAACATFIIGVLYQTVGVRTTQVPLAEADRPVATDYAVQVADSTAALPTDSNRTLPEFDFTPVAGQ